jgi:hypothetical protein
VAQPSSQVAASWVKAEIRSGDWVSLREICHVAVTSKWTGRSPDEIADYIEENISYVAEHLRDEAGEWGIDGTPARFEIDNEPIPYVRGLASYASNVLVKLRQMDPIRVEALCAEVLKKLGANSYSTQATADGGIDFIGSHMNIVPGAFTIPDACRATVIGQTKRYKEGNVINETTVREFVGAAVLRRHELQKDGKAGPMSPTIFAFWTTSDFHPNAKKFAKSTGLWYMDGYTFATYVNELGLAGALLAD